MSKKFIETTARTFNIMNSEQFEAMMAKYARSTGQPIKCVDGVCFMPEESVQALLKARKHLPTNERVHEIQNRVNTEEELIAEAARARTRTVEAVEDRLRAF
ncbi:MAG: hypothetical protein HYT94_04270 [Parcubacteria group bacterium]|nr:hypothetical protein [Parcubacteria group bacterium]